MPLWQLLGDHSCHDDPLCSGDAALGQRGRDSPHPPFDQHSLDAVKQNVATTGGRHMRDKTKEGQRPHVRCPNHFYWKKTTCDGIHQAEVNLPTQLLAGGAEPDGCNMQGLSLYHLQTHRWYSISEQMWPVAVTLADRRLKSCFGLDYTGKYTAPLLWKNDALKMRSCFVVITRWLTQYHNSVLKTYMYVSTRQRVP